MCFTVALQCRIERQGSRVQKLHWPTIDPDRETWDNAGMRLEEVLPALRAGEVEGIRCDNWAHGHYWAMRRGDLAKVYPEITINLPDLLGDKWSVVAHKPKPIEHAVHIDGREYARIRDGRQSALILSTTLFRPGDILLIKDRDTREVLTAEVTHEETRTTLTIVHFRLIGGRK